MAINEIADSDVASNGIDYGRHLLVMIVVRLRQEKRRSVAGKQPLDIACLIQTY